MGTTTRIAWCDHTFNAWVGCAKVSPACDHCYAEAWAKRAGWPELWQGHRRRTTVANWNKPLQWNRAALAAGERRRVFALSLGDWLDDAAPQEWRCDLGTLIGATPGLDWLLLSKRIEAFAELAPWPLDRVPANVWLGITAEDQDHFDRRWAVLSQLGARVRFISYEPALGPLRLPAQNPPEWIICGGESGHGARPMQPVWALDLRDQCARAGIPFFFKQWGKQAAGALLDGREHRAFPAP